MNIYIYIYIYVCMYVCMYIYIYIYTHICTHLSLYLYIYISLSLYLSIYLSIYFYIYIYIYTYIHLYITPSRIGQACSVTPSLVVEHVTCPPPGGEPCRTKKTSSWSLIFQGVPLYLFGAYFASLSFPYTWEAAGISPDRRDATGFP